MASTTTGNQNWVIHAPKPIQPKIFETNGGALSLEHFKLPFTAEVKSAPSPPLPEHDALPPNLNRLHQSPNPSTVEKRSRVKPPRGPHGVINQRKVGGGFNSFSSSAQKNAVSRWEALDRSRMAVTREQDEQAAEARPRLVIPQRSGTGTIDQGGQVYRPPHLRDNTSTGPNRMPSYPPRHVESKNWRRSPNP